MRRHAFEQLRVITRRPRAAPGRDRAHEFALGIGHDLVRVEFAGGAEARTRSARARCAVEREVPWLERRIRDAAIRARARLREERLLAAGFRLPRDRAHAAAERERGRERFQHARARRFAHHDAIHHRLDRVHARLREHNLAREIAQLAVDARAHEALLRELGEFLLMFAFSFAHDRREQRRACTLAEREHARRHLLHGLARDRLPALMAVSDSDTRKQQPQVIEQFGGGANRRARAAADGGLLDRDRRREPRNGFDFGPRQLIEELPRVGRERFDVAALAFGVERVEGE